MSIKEKILKIMSLALEINPPEVKNIGEKRTAVFVYWAPHCNRVDVDIHSPCWNGDAHSAVNIYLYTNGEDTHERLDEVIETLEKIKAEVEA